MSPEEIKIELEKAHTFREESEADYRQHINRYTFSLLVAELAVVGFLLQKPTSAVLLEHNGAKLFLLLSLYLCFFSLFSGLLDKFLMARFAKNLHYSWQYKARSKESGIAVTVDGGMLPPDENALQKAGAVLRTAYLAGRLAAKLRAAAEILLVSAAFFAVVLVTVLITNLG